MKETINNKGITLIALVITIIILLILAGISIITLSNSGLFDKVKEAKEKYKVGKEDEVSTINDYSNQIDLLISNRNDENYNLIWKNENQTANFIAQDITINNLLDYKELKIIYDDAAGQKIYKQIIMPIVEIGASNYLFDVWVVSNGTNVLSVSRSVTIKDNAISFGVGRYSSKGTDNTRCVPIYIYGIKK